MIDFLSAARARAGATWPKLSAAEQRAHVKAEKVRWLTAMLGGVARDTYAEWLKVQPPAVQDQILGAARASRFRNGTLSINRFTDYGKPLSLDELVATRPELHTRPGHKPDEE